MSAPRYILFAHTEFSAGGGSDIVDCFFEKITKDEAVNHIKNKILNCKSNLHVEFNCSLYDLIERVEVFAFSACKEPITTYKVTIEDLDN